MNKFVDFFMKYKWQNIFARDMFLIVVIVWINETLDYNSWFAAVLVGMMIVLVSWHFSDLMKEKRRLDNSIHRYNGNGECPTGIVYNSIQQNKEPELERHIGGDKGYD